MWDLEIFYAVPDAEVCDADLKYKYEAVTYDISDGVMNIGLRNQGGIVIIPLHMIASVMVKHNG